MSAKTSIMERESGFDDVNQRTFSRSDVVRYYGSRDGYMDPGEQWAFAAIGTRATSGTLLDIGVGGGRTIPLLSNLAAHYVGIDYVKSNIDVAAACYPGADLRTLDARDLPWEDGSVDVVVFSFNGIDSVDFDARRRILEEVYRVLASGGLFVFSCLNLDGPSAREWIDIPLRTRAGLSSFLKDIVKLPIWAFRCFSSGIPVYFRTRLSRLDVPSGFALLQPPAHNYGLSLMFSSVPAMTDMLNKIGFGVQRTHGVDGHSFTSRDQDRRSPWCYFVTTKP